jgi:hypothetical protein
MYMKARFRIVANTTIVIQDSQYKEGATGVVVLLLDSPQVVPGYHTVETLLCVVSTTMHVKTTQTNVFRLLTDKEPAIQITET